MIGQIEKRNSKEPTINNFVMEINPYRLLNISSKKFKTQE